MLGSIDGPEGSQGAGFFHENGFCGFRPHARCASVAIAYASNIRSCVLSAAGPCLALYIHGPNAYRACETAARDAVPAIQPVECQPIAVRLPAEQAASRIFATSSFDVDELEPAVNTRLRFLDSGNPHLYVVHVLVDAIEFVLEFEQHAQCWGLVHCN